MKRKTNLFYTDGPDSKFLTFSNYTECLTGNYLSLESKLFPDKFLCLKIKNLNKNTKADFIKYIVAYYENKLALLRDYNIQEHNNVEFNMHPLSYLLEAILYVCNYDSVNKEWTFSDSKLNSIITQQYTEFENSTFNNNLIRNYVNNNILQNLITYVGETTEQDYNGIYADTICTIDLNVYNEGEIILKDIKTYDLETKITADDDSSSNKLYGWVDEDFIVRDQNNSGSEYEYVKPIYDLENKTYVFNSLLSQLRLREISKNDAAECDKTLQFNVIIPLFSLVNRNISVENWETYSEDSTNYSKYINLDNINGHVYDVPYGIWINAEDNDDTFIELKKDINLKMYPSWSLLISSQFKPFPYSNELVEENYSKNSILHAHATYAEILGKLNNFMDTFSSFNNELIKLNNRIKSVENSIKEMGTVANISDTNKKLINTEIRITNMIDDLKEKIYGYIDNITWSDHITTK